MCVGKIPAWIRLENVNWVVTRPTHQLGGSLGSVEAIEFSSSLLAVKFRGGRGSMMMGSVFVLVAVPILLGLLGRRLLDGN
jgi:hypothetical protein